MDFIFNVSMLDNMELNSTLSSIPPLKTIPNSLKITVTCIAGLGVILNSLIIVSLSRPGLKTNLKLVVSLAFADLLTSVFHVMMPFVIDFQTPWTEQEALSMLFETSETIDALFSPNLSDIEWTNFTLEKFKNIPEEIETSKKDVLNVGMSFDLPNIIRSGNMSVFEKKTLFDASPILQKCLSSFYLMPNVASVLTMMTISIALLITVKCPLTYKDILSSRCGTKLCVTIWVCSSSVSLVTFLYILVIENNIYTFITVARIQIGIWCLAILIFVLLVGLYAAILYIIKSSANTPSLVSVKRSNTKAVVTAAGILGTYAVCCLSFAWALALERIAFVYNEIKANGLGRIEDVNWMNFFQVLFVVNLVIDPLIYAFRLPEVAMSVRKLWRRLASNL